MQNILDYKFYSPKRAKPSYVNQQDTQREGWSKNYRGNILFTPVRLKKKRKEGFPTENEISVSIEGDQGISDLPWKKSPLVKQSGMFSGLQSHRTTAQNRYASPVFSPRDSKSKIKHFNGQIKKADRLEIF